MAPRIATTCETIAVLLLLLAAASDVVRAEGSQVSRTESASRAAAFILSSRAEATLSWSPREAAGALLALAANDPGDWATSRGETAEAIATKNGVRMALLQLVSGVAKKGGAEYDGLDHSQLSQFLGAIRVLCEDPMSFYGHDLVAEAERRASRGVPAASPANAGLALTLCTQGVEVPHVLLTKLFMPKGDKCRDLCFERAALNIMALSCIYREKQITYDSKTVTTLMRTNIERVNADLAEPDFLDAPANIFRLALVLQIVEDSPFAIEAADEDAVARKLISLQRENGSFGDSVGVTAAVVPALAGMTAADVRNIKCSRKETKKPNKGDSVVINYEISESAFKSQSFVGKIVAKAGATLHEALTSYQSEYPEVFSIDVMDSGFGAFITEINDLKSKRRFGWQVVGQAEQDLNKIRVRDGDTYRISYQRL